MLSPGLLVFPALGLLSLYILYHKRTASRSNESPSVAIVVLGDIGRSPRMLFHATSLVESGLKVIIVAYRGSTPPKALLESSNVEFVYLPTTLPWIRGLPRILFLLLSPTKVVMTSLNLAWALLVRIEVAPTWIMIQNPPAIPTLPIVKVCASIRNSNVIIDWHNTGWSVLALRLGERSPVVRLAKWIESTWGRTAYAHLCVTEAMKAHLIKEIGLSGKIIVFHDRPPASFRRQTIIESHELFSRLDFLQSASLVSFYNSSSSVAPEATSTMFTSLPSASSPVTLLSTRPCLLVSSTSWTADEDFSILLEALQQYEDAAVASPVESLPKILMVITGKGAGRALFEEEVARRENSWKHVRIRCVWLHREDYPKLLGSADLGVSLHTSTSGADLPMKVVDMFGCGLPVCALEFACINELVKHNVNGLTFSSSTELFNQLTDLLKDFAATTQSTQLDKLRKGITECGYGAEEDEEWSTWEVNWRRRVGGLFDVELADT